MTICTLHSIGYMWRTDPGPGHFYFYLAYLRDREGKRLPRPGGQGGRGWWLHIHNMKCGGCDKCAERCEHRHGERKARNWLDVHMMHIVQVQATSTVNSNENIKKEHYLPLNNLHSVHLD